MATYGRGYQPSLAGLALPSFEVGVNGGEKLVSIVTITLIGRPGCHLCEAAHDVIHQVIGPEDRFEEISLLDDPELMAKYSEDIPVVLINGQVHDFLRIDPIRLHTALVSARAS